MDGSWMVISHAAADFTSKTDACQRILCRIWSAFTCTLVFRLMSLVWSLWTLPQKKWIKYAKYKSYKVSNLTLTISFVAMIKTLLTCDVCCFVMCARTWYTYGSFASLMCSLYFRWNSTAIRFWAIFFFGLFHIECGEMCVHLLAVNTLIDGEFVMGCGQ